MRTAKQPAAPARRGTVRSGASQRDDRTARTIRFPDGLRARLAADAERCERSFEAHVLAILRRHYGEDVDIAPAPATVIAMTRGSLIGVHKADLGRLTAGLRDPRGAYVTARTVRRAVDRSSTDRRT